ncbi:MAG: hypothetical protein KatS3mg083_132 [Candidatus Dojkabacteria bacterium]|nr:MAG: hypothetical protein KatS3mg083_132 [Candidatus Dojkabacteria bacterium]
MEYVGNNILQEFLQYNISKYDDIIIYLDSLIHNPNLPNKIKNQHTFLLSKLIAEYCDKFNSCSTSEFLTNILQIKNQKLITAILYMCETYEDYESYLSDMYNMQIENEPIIYQYNFIRDKRRKQLRLSKDYTYNISDLITQFKEVSEKILSTLLYSESSSAKTKLLNNILPVAITIISYTTPEQIFDSLHDVFTEFECINCGSRKYKRTLKKFQILPNIYAPIPICTNCKTLNINEEKLARIAVMYYTCLRLVETDYGNLPVVALLS